MTLTQAPQVLHVPMPLTALLGSTGVLPSTQMFPLTARGSRSSRRTAAFRTAPVRPRCLVHHFIINKIGHTKQGGQMGRSRMKSDETTKSAGCASVFGFNARQLARDLAGGGSSLKL